MADKSFEDMAKEVPQKGGEVGIGPDSNMAALMSMADDILAQPIPGEAGAAGAPPEGAPMDAPADAPMDEPMDGTAMADGATGATNLTPIEAMLKENNPGISDTDATQQAEDLWNAAGERSDLAQMTPDELTAELKKDSGLLMELKKLAARGEPAGEEMPGAMAAAEPPAGAPPMGEPPMGGMMPPGM